MNLSQFAGCCGHLKTSKQIFQVMSIITIPRNKPPNKISHDTQSTQRNEQKANISCLDFFFRFFVHALFLLIRFCCLLLPCVSSKGICESRFFCHNADENKLHRLYTLKPGKEKENKERKKNRITNLVSLDEEANKIREA